MLAFQDLAAHVVFAECSGQLRRDEFCTVYRQRLGMLSSSTQDALAAHRERLEIELEGKNRVLEAERLEAGGLAMACGRRSLQPVRENMREISFSQEGSCLSRKSKRSWLAQLPDLSASRILPVVQLPNHLAGMKGERKRCLDYEQLQSRAVLAVCQLPA